MDIEAVIGLFAQIVSTTVLLIFVWRFPNLYFVIALGFGQVFLSGLCNLIAIWRLSPGFLCNPWRIKPAFVGALFSFGGWSQICSLSSVINLEADKFVLGHFLGVASVTPYQVGNKVALLNRILPLQILGALLPDTTAAVSRGAALAQMQTIYARNSRYLMIATLLITGFIVAVADVFIRVWIGAPVPMAAAVTTALVISYSVNNLTGIGTVFMKAEGKPKYEAYYAMLGAAANIIFTIILTPQFGLYGVIGGTILGNCIGSVFFIVLFHRINGFPWWPTVGRWLLPLLIGVCAAIVATRALLWAIPGGWVQTRALGLLLLGVGGSAYVAVLIGVLAVFRFWTPEDLALVRRLGGRFVGRRGETITLSASEGNLS